MKYIITEKQLTMINEKIGIANEILDLTKELFNIIVKNIKMNDEKIDFTLTIDKKYLKNLLPIKKVLVIVENSNNYNGKIFVKDFNNEYGDKEYFIKINFKINYDNLDFNKIESILSHELHHFYDIFKKNDKFNDGKIKLNKELKLFYFNKNPLIKEFLNMFYLSLDEEINARVHQLSVDLKNISKNNFKNEIVNQQPYIDANLLMNYNINKLDILSDNEKKELIEKINLDGIFSFNNFEELKKYFNKQFKIKGMKLYKKVLKLSGFLYGKEYLIENFNEEIMEIPLECFSINPKLIDEILTFSD